MHERGCLRRFRLPDDDRDHPSLSSTGKTTAAVSFSIQSALKFHRLPSLPQFPNPDCGRENDAEYQRRDHHRLQIQGDRVQDQEACVRRGNGCEQMEQGRPGTKSLSQRNFESLRSRYRMISVGEGKQSGKLRLHGPGHPGEGKTLSSNVRTGTAGAKPSTPTLLQGIILSVRRTDDIAATSAHAGPGNPPGTKGKDRLPRGSSPSCPFIPT
ncbi:MAG: hypothetical protein PWP08_583 [Methanofollis sp.]|nr:hypothetical protein [Methanofollis sp.]